MEAFYYRDPSLDVHAHTLVLYNMLRVSVGAMFLGCVVQRAAKPTTWRRQLFTAMELTPVCACVALVLCRRYCVLLWQTCVPWFSGG